MSSAIKVKSLVKRYGSLTAVDNISFEVREGDFFAFLGPNGAGKSTTVNILCTLMARDSGAVEICGFKAGKEDNEIRRRIGVVFQDNCLDDLLTVRQNLVFRAGLYEKDMKKIKSRLDDICSILNLGELLGRPFGKLSGGQRRRCEIARALMNSPEILFLDEPSTGLDPQTRFNVWECIEFIRKEHKTTIFLTTHYMEEASGADGIAIIDGGRIVASGSPLELKKAYASDIMKVVPFDTDGIKSAFEELMLDYGERSGTFQIRIPDSLKALQILKRLEKYVSSFEVIHGTIDDVFLNITGRSLRED